ncbi:MAG: AAA family ATPase [Byssovorax sp.]
MSRPWDITGDEIQIWSQRVEASAVLPDLVRRLLLATSPIGTVDMRADGGTRLAGWDGVVQALRATAFCPRGQSVWELSVEGTRSKLDDDFAKRTDAPPAPIRPSATTYVALLARRFRDKASWAADRRALGKWIEVRLLDADDLAAWLTQAPAVARWFGAQLDKPAYDAVDLDTFVARWRARTSPPLPIELLLAGRERERAAEQVRSWARTGRPQPLFVRGDTKEEAVVFSAAALALAPSPEGDLWRARTLVVENEAALRWAYRVAAAEPLIVLPGFDGMDTKFIERTAFVVVPLDSAAGTGGALRPLTLEPVPYRRIAEILVEGGFPRSHAERRAEESGGKLSALQRLYGYVSLPAWAAPLDPVPLAAMLLVGAYQPENEADREVIRSLGAEPRDVESLCERLRLIPDAATVRDQERWGRATWRWIAEGDAWKALVGSIPAETLRRFHETVIAVLGKADPRFELEANERFAAAMHGKVLQESAALREGLVRALVRLALGDEDLVALHGPKRGSTAASIVVRRLLEPQWMRWASLADLLPLLAEAAPEAFLDRLEESLLREDEGAAHLLAEEGQFGSPHTGLLWALETLGWSETYMARVAEALATLAEYDAGQPEKKGRMSNRPAASLNRLLRLGHSQTSASGEQQVSVMKRLMEVTPQIAFRLLVGQLAETGFGFMMDVESRKPAWRPAPVLDQREQQGTEASQYFELTLACVGNDAGRWAYLLRRGEMRAEHGEYFLDRLEIVQPDIRDDAAEIWGAIRHILHWSPTSATWQRWNRLYGKFKPLDPVLSYEWLFLPGAELPDPFNGTPDLYAQARRLNELRAEAIESIRRERKDWLNVVTLLAEKVNEPYFLGSTLGKSSFARELEAYLIDAVPSTPLLPHIPSYLAARLQAEGKESFESKLRALIDHGRLEPVVATLSLFSGDPMIWDLADSLGENVRRAYWRNCEYVFGEHSAEDWARAIKNLLEAENIVGAVRNAECAKDKISTETIARTLEALVADPNEVMKFSRDGSFSYILEQLMDRLERAADVDSKYGVLLANTEFVYVLGAFEPKRSTRRLSAFFASDTRQFTELVKRIYRGNAEPYPPLADAEQEAKQRAHAAYRVLEAWKGYPGEGLPADQREEILYDWSLTALRELAEEGRHDTGASEVSRVLARAASGEDGRWPCVAARRLIESGEFPKLIRFLHAAKRNLRGWTSRSPGEGGKQEREIALAFQHSTNAFRLEWPRTAALLDGLARAYEYEAEQQDATAQAELRHEGAEPEDFINPAPESPRTKPPSDPPMFPGIVRFESIALSSVAAVAGLTITPADPPPDKGQMIVLLGKNGAGKTSTLRAVALALATHPAASAGIAALPVSIVNNQAEAAICTVRCGGRDYSATLRLTNRGTDLSQVPSDNTERPLVFGYGCRRGSALGGPDAMDFAAEFSDIATLFSESSRVYPALEWLKRLERLAQEKHGGFERIAYETILAELRGLLPDVEEVYIRNDDVWAKAPKLGGEVRVASLSDGYLTTIGWVVDLVARWLRHADKLGLPRTANFFKEMTGVVLIDEIDQHLHPQWQQHVLSDVRRLFPRMTFIVTTHNPFTLLGARAEEIWLLERDEDDKIVARQSRARPPLMTGSDLYETYFGMTTVFPNELGAMLDRYSFISRNPVRSDEEDADMRDLLARLRAAGIEPGMTPVPREPLSSEPAPGAP